MMSSLPLFVATVAAFLVVSGAEHHRNILVTTTVNETHCMAASNEGQFYHYGVALAGNHDANPAVLAVQYEGLDVTCCEFNLVNNSTMSFEDVSSTTGPTPCSDLKECQENGGCDENATCVYGETGVFQCQCTDLYEGDGSSCSRKPHWSEWGPFGPYSKSCGIVTKTRTRTCSKPPRCEGEDTETVTDHLAPCPVPTTTTLPPTRFMVCGTENCDDCPGGADTCEHGDLDADRHEDHLKNCPSGYKQHSFKTTWKLWIIKEKLRVCSSLPPAPVPKYRYQMCGVLNCIGCEQELCVDQDKLHLVAAEELDQSAQCPEGYSEDMSTVDFRVCRSDDKFLD